VRFDKLFDLKRTLQDIARGGRLPGAVGTGNYNQLWRSILVRVHRRLSALRLH